MSLTLGTILTAARDVHPAFHKTRVPNAVLARHLTGYQRQLISRLADLDDSLVAQQASIVFAADGENAIGTVGAGTAGGLPGDLVGGAPVALKESAGSAVEVNTEDAAVLVAETVVSSATLTTLTRTSAGWTVNAFAGKIVEITIGPGARDRREIASNTADTLTLVSGTTWTTLPTAESVFRILDRLLDVTKELGVVTELMPTGVRQGYLVRLDANGVPYLDLGKPLLARFDEGIDLPPADTIIGGTVRFTDGGTTERFFIRPYRLRGHLDDGRVLSPHRQLSDVRRVRGRDEYVAWREGGKLYLAGEADDWRDVASIDLRYIPIAPEFTALTDLFLVPDTAYAALVASAALKAGQRVNGLPDVPKIDVQALAAEAQAAEETFLNGVDRQFRAVTSIIRDVS
jgi:hypothetical protein